MSNSNLIFFDGVCNLCNGFVRFVTKRDKKKVFRFISLQSDEAKKILHSARHQDISLQTVLYAENSTHIYSKSTAVLKIMKHFGFPYHLLFNVGIIIPKYFRDLLYDYIAKNRYKWFGKQDSCTL